MQFDEYQKRINMYLQQYEKADNKAQKLWKKIDGQITYYRFELEDNYGSQQRLQWVQNTKKRLAAARQKKNLVQDKVQVADILRMGKQTDDKLNQIHKNIHEAIKVSTYIRVQLDQQIEQLDNLYDQNKDFKKRVKKAKKGLRVIIRRAMLNRCTRFMCVLTVLGVIATIIIYILKDNSII